MESSLQNVLAIVGIVLLVAVTGGVAYLTLSDWRDKRRQEEEKLQIRRSIPKRK